MMNPLYPLGSLDLPDCPVIASAERFGGGWEEEEQFIKEEEEYENPESEAYVY